MIRLCQITDRAAWGMFIVRIAMALSCSLFFLGNVSSGEFPSLIPLAGIILSLCLLLGIATEIAAFLLILLYAITMISLLFPSLSILVAVLTVLVVQGGPLLLGLFALIIGGPGKFAFWIPCKLMGCNCKI